MIKYYEDGGQLPTVEKILVSYNGRVWLATLDEIGELYENRKDSSLPLLDVSKPFYDCLCYGCESRAAVLLWRVNPDGCLD